MKGKNLQPGLLYPARFSFRFDGEAKSFAAAAAKLLPPLCDLMVRRSSGFSVHGQEYWNGLPFPPPEDLPNPGIEPMSLLSPELAGGIFTTTATWGNPAG